MNRIVRKLLPAAVVALVGVGLLPSTVTGQVAPPVPGPLFGIGKDLWTAQISCWDCHGNMASGRNEDPRSPQGSNLRQTFLNVDLIAETIRCGRPGTPMPSFSRTAYMGANPCYGLTPQALGANAPPTGRENLNARQTQALAQFIVFQFVGKGEVSREECQALYGPTASSCTRWPTIAELAAMPPVTPPAAPP